MNPEESIYNLIPREYVPGSKPPKHTSKFRGMAVGEYKSNKDPCKTMGPAKVETRSTEDFIKKHEREPKLPEKKPFVYPDAEHRKPLVPRKNEQPIIGLKTTKDFIKLNAVDNIMSVAKKPAKNFVDTKKGDKQPLETSGLEPKYVHKKDFGNTPMYIERRKEEIQRAQDEYDQYVAEHFRRGAMHSLSEDERNAILDGLKTNWEMIHHEYQNLSVVTDTAPKKLRKERMESEMKQLERDIEAIEKHKIIYLAN